MIVRSLVSTLVVFAPLSSAQLVAQERQQDESAPSLRSLQIDDTFKIKSVRSPSVSPDGKTIAFVSNRTEEPDTNYNNSVWLVDAENTDKGKNLIQLTTSPGTEDSPTWHPNGRTIAYVSAPDVLGSHYATHHLAVIDIDGGEPRLLTEELDRNISGLEYSEDGKHIYFQLEDSGENHIARIPAGGGRITRPISGQISAGGYSLADNGALVARISKPKFPGELFIADQKGLRQISLPSRPTTPSR